MRELCTILEDATENKDLLHYQESMNLILQNTLFTHFRKTTPKSSTIYHKLVFAKNDDTFSFYPESSFGFVRNSTKNHHVVDYLIHDLDNVSTFTSVVSNTQAPHNEAFATLYEDNILPLFSHINETDTTHITILKKYTFTSHLNKSCFPLQLNQLFHALQPDESFPVFFAVERRSSCKKTDIKIYVLRYEYIACRIIDRIQ